MGKRGDGGPYMRLYTDTRVVETPPILEIHDAVAIGVEDPG